MSPTGCVSRDHRRRRTRPGRYGQRGHAVVQPRARPGIVAVPQTKAKPAAEPIRRVVAPASPVAARSVDCVAVLTPFA